MRPLLWKLECKDQFYLKVHIVLAEVRQSLLFMCRTNVSAMQHVAPTNNGIFVIKNVDQII